MEPYTMDRNFQKKDIIEEFSSIIWTERYYGDSSVELIVPAKVDLIQKLPKGIFLGLDKSDEVMILETKDIEDNKLKLTGISILPWLNNRFVRASSNHEETVWKIPDAPAGYQLWQILYNMCVVGSPYLDGSEDTGIPNPERLAIPNLGLESYDISGLDIKAHIPYGPVYNAMREIATSAEIGMTITLRRIGDSYLLGFRSYKGLDRTSGQSINDPVQFSPQMDSLTNIKELESLSLFKTLVFAFAYRLDEVDRPLATTPGEAKLPEYSGFDLRAEMIFVDNIDHDTIGGNAGVIASALKNRADLELLNNKIIQVVDGEIVPTSQFRYGIHYNLGDLIEMQGSSGIIQKCRVTEYIRAQDEAGERAYPTVEKII